MFVDYEPKVPQPPRPRFRRGEIIFHQTEFEEDVEEDLLTLKFFDFMVCGTFIKKFQ